MTPHLTGWRDIESAKHDGEDVLLWIPSLRRVRLGFWRKKLKWWGFYGSLGLSHERTSKPAHPLHAHPRPTGVRSMTKRVTQAELDAAWSDLNTLPTKASAMRKDLAALEAQIERAYAVVNLARLQAGEPA